MALRSFDWLRMGVVAVREHVGGHLEAHRLHARPDHLGGDRIDGVLGRQALSTAGELHQIDVHARILLTHS